VNRENIGLSVLGYNNIDIFVFIIVTISYLALELLKSLRRIKKVMYRNPFLVPKINEIPFLFCTLLFVFLFYLTVIIFLFFYV